MESDRENYDDSGSDIEYGGGDVMDFSDENSFDGDDGENIMLQATQIVVADGHEMIENHVQLPMNMDPILQNTEVFDIHNRSSPLARRLVASMASNLRDSTSFWTYFVHQYRSIDAPTKVIVATKVFIVLCCLRAEHWHLKQLGRFESTNEEVEHYLCKELRLFLSHDDAEIDCGGEDIDWTCQWVRPCIYHAACSGDRRWLRLLVEYGADVSGYTLDQGCLFTLAGIQQDVCYTNYRGRLKFFDYHRLPPKRPLMDIAFNSDIYSPYDSSHCGMPFARYLIEILGINVDLIYHQGKVNNQYLRCYVDDATIPLFRLLLQYTGHITNFYSFQSGQYFGYRNGDNPTSQLLPFFKLMLEHDLIDSDIPTALIGHKQGKFILRPLNSEEEKELPYQVPQPKVPGLILFVRHSDLEISTLPERILNCIQYRFTRSSRDKESMETVKRVKDMEDDLLCFFVERELVNTMVFLPSTLDDGDDIELDPSYLLQQTNRVGSGPEYAYESDDDDDDDESEEEFFKRLQKVKEKNERVRPLDVTTRGIWYQRIEKYGYQNCILPMMDITDKEREKNISMICCKFFNYERKCISVSLKNSPRGQLIIFLAQHGYVKALKALLALSRRHRDTSKLIGSVHRTLATLAMFHAPTVEILKYLVEEGADVNHIMKVKYRGKIQNCPRHPTVLFAVCDNMVKLHSTPDEEQNKLIVRNQGEMREARDDNGDGECPNNTTTIDAIRYIYEETYFILTDEQLGYDMYSDDYTSMEGDTVLSVSCKKLRCMCVAALLQWGYRYKMNITPVLSNDGMGTVVDYIIPKGECVNSNDCLIPWVTVDSDGSGAMKCVMMPFLHYIIATGSDPSHNSMWIDMSTKLLQFDINARDREGNTPLIYAVKQCNDIQIVKLTLYGADIRVCNNVGESALSLASAMFADRIIRIEYGLRKTNGDVDQTLKLLNSQHERKKSRKRSFATLDDH